MIKKTIAQSKTSISQLMLIHHANQAGNVHGGEIMKCMDNAAGVTAIKHARSNVVTARVDELQFHLPIYVGNLLICTAEITFVGRSSMEVLVTVDVDDLVSEVAPRRALNAFFTMVALDEHGKPQEIPQLELLDENEKKRFEEGKARYLDYKKISI